MAESTETQEKINRLSMMEQSLHQVLAQKQQLQSQLLEIESALEESEGTDKVYKIIGNIMISSDKEKIKTELEEKKKLIEVKLNSLEVQEKKIADRTKDLQKEVMKEMK